MAHATRGDIVKVHYTGSLGDGTVFDSSAKRSPLEFTIGQGQVIAGFEQAVDGMAIGNRKRVVIPAAQAYGVRDERLVIQMDLSRLPSDLELEVQDRLRVRRPDGRMMDVTVTELNESTVTLDGNHFLAGQNLTFDIELVEILQSK
jgi:peptidylprolyl isomerase